MSDTEREILASKIEEAFESVEYPGDDNIVEKSVNVPEEIQDAFQGKSWKEISLATTCEFRLDLPSFTPAAFRYYLPAFLITGLRSTIDSPCYGGLLEFTFYNLIPILETSPSKERFIDRMQGFDEKQKDVLKEFVRFNVKPDNYDKELYGRKMKELYGKQIEEFWGSDIWDLDN